MAIPLYRGSAGADGAACCGTEILQPYLAGGEGGLHIASIRIFFPPARSLSRLYLYGRGEISGVCGYACYRYFSLQPAFGRCSPRAGCHLPAGNRMPETRLAGDFLFSSRFQGAQIPGAGELHARYPGEAAGAFAEPVVSAETFAAGSPTADPRGGGFFSRLCRPFCAGKRKMGKDQGERNGYSSVDCRCGAPCRFFGYQQGEDLRLWRKSPERSALCPGYSGD